MKTPSAPTEARVVLIEDQAKFREHLSQVINDDPYATVCGEAGDMRDAMNVIETSKPDVAVVDISVDEPAGFELIKNLRDHGIKIPVLVLSMQDESHYAERVLRGGASGYLSKDQCVAEIRTAIHRVFDGDCYLSPSLTNSLIQRMMVPLADPRIPRIALLTDLELKIFRLLGAGLKTRKIAERLHLTETAVHSHRFRIRRKLDMKNAAELAYHAAHWEEAC